MTDMRINLKGYVPEPGRGGQTRHRVRVHGNAKKRITIPYGPDNEEFMPFYLAARKGYLLEQTATPEPEPIGHIRSLDASIDGYLEYLQKRVDKGLASPGTRKQRKSLLKRAADFKCPKGDRMGELHYELSPDGVEYIRDQWEDVTAQADNCVKAMAAMFKWLKIRPNPASGIAKVHVNQGGATPWTSADLKKFMGNHPDGSNARIWLYLAMFSGARREDLATLGRSHEVERDGLVWMEWQPAKKGSAFVSIPMMPQLLEATRAMKVQGLAYLLSDHGRPFRNGNSLGTKVQKWTAEAGLTKRSSHGLRKALAALLAEMGCTTHQIMAVLAHNKASTSEVYTKSAARTQMAKAAFETIKHVRL
jgi:integrase